MSTPNNFPPAPQNSNNTQGYQPYPPAPQQSAQPQAAQQPQISSSAGDYPAFPSQPAASKSRNMSLESAGFFKALFDMNFHHFVTIKFAKLIYTLCIALTVLWVVMVPFILFIFMSVEGEAGTGFILGLTFLVIGAVCGLISIIGTRLFLEMSVALIRVAENSSQLRIQAAETHELLEKK